MKEIPLSRGYVAQVDDSDYEWLSRHKWHVIGPNRKLYAARKYKRDGVKTTLLMHIEIMNPPKGMQVDHIDGNQFNCQRSNLRLATTQQNNYNRQKRDTVTSSQYKGVSWDKNLKKWRAWIRHEGNRIYLGVHHYEKGAALAYDEAALKYHGKFARLNFPNDIEVES